MTSTSIKFHSVRGENIALQNHETRASRYQSFNKALCFTARPLEPLEKLVFKICDSGRDWSGFLRLGVTQNDPVIYKGKLPRYCCPDFNMMPGNWAKAVPDTHAKKDSVLQVYYLTAGCVMLSKDGLPFEEFIFGVRTNKPLFIVFDIYGNTKSIELVSVVPKDQSNASLSTEVRPCSYKAQCKSKSFPSVLVEEAAFEQSLTNTARVTNLVAEVLHVKEGQMAIVKTPIIAGQGVIVELSKAESRRRVAMVLSSSSVNDIANSGSFAQLCESSTSALFNSSLITSGEELVVVVSDEGMVFVCHGGSKWVKTVNVDPKGYFHLVFSLQYIEKLVMIGLSSQLQAPSSALSENNSPAVRLKAANRLENQNTESMSDCVICLEEKREVLTEPCNHFALCLKCADTLMSTPETAFCPVCREEISSSKKIFLA